MFLNSVRVSTTAMWCNRVRPHLGALMSPDPFIRRQAEQPLKAMSLGVYGRKEMVIVAYMKGCRLLPST